MSDIRKYTNLFLELADEGLLSWQSIAEMALSYMSEDDVEDMFHCNDLDEFDPEDEDDYDYDDLAEEEELGIGLDNGEDLDEDDKTESYEDYHYEEEFEKE